MSIRQLGSVAAGYSQAMDNIGMRLQDPDIVKDPARLAMFNVEMFQATSAYEMTARTIQNLHREDQMLAELLRDA